MEPYPKKTAFDESYRPATFTVWRFDVAGEVSATVHFRLRATLDSIAWELPAVWSKVGSGFRIQKVGDRVEVQHVAWKASPVAVYATGWRDYPYDGLQPSKRLYCLPAASVQEPARLMQLEV